MEYEGLPNICFNCRLFSHLTEGCRKNVAQIVTASGDRAKDKVDIGLSVEGDRFVDRFGPWMQVARKSNCSNSRWSKNV